MSILSQLGISTGIFDIGIKAALRALIGVGTFAAAGSVQGDATPITTSGAVVTGSDGAKGVRLPKAERDMRIEITNTVAGSDLLVYPDTGAVINAIAADTAFTQVGGSRAVYVCDDLLHWYVAASNVTGTATTSSTAELNFNDGSLAGTAVASKTLVLGATKNVDTLDVVTLKNDGQTMSSLKYVSVALTAATLDGALSVVVQAAAAGDQWKVRDILLEGGGTNFGAGGDRTIVLTDGTTTWTTIPNASIETLAAAGARWGSTALPATTTSNTASAAATDIVFKYAGGTTDHTTGASRATVCLEKVA